MTLGFSELKGRDMIDTGFAILLILMFIGLWSLTVRIEELEEWKRENEVL